MNYTIEPHEKSNFTLEHSKALPNLLRERLLQDHAKGCFMLELCYYIGMRRGCYLTLRTLRDVLTQLDLHIPDALLRSGLGDTDIFERGKIMLRQRGRPEIGYYVPDVNEVAQRFGVDRRDKESEWADRLRDEDFASLAAYRAGLHHAFIERAPGQYSRDFLANRLAVSKATSRRYDRRERAGCVIVPFPNYNKEIFYGDVDIDTLPRKYSLEAVYRKKNGLYVERRIPAQSRAAAFWSVKKKAIIYLVEQLPNTYQIQRINAA